MFEPSLAFINILNTVSDKNLRFSFEKEVDEDKILDKSSKNLRYLVNTEGTNQVLGLMTKALQVDHQKITFGKNEEDEEEIPEEETQASFQYNYDYPPAEDYIVNRTLWPELNKLYGHGYELKAIAVNSNGTIIASSCKSQSKDHACIILWDPKKYNIIDKLYFHSYTAVALEFSSDDKYLVSVSRDRQIGLFQLDESDNQHPYKLIWDDKSHSRIVWTVSFSHDVKFFITGSRDKAIKIWKVENNKPTKVCDHVFDKPVTAVAFNHQLVRENVHLFAVGLENGDIHLCEFDSGTNKLNQLGSIPIYWKPSLAVNKIKFRPNIKENKLTFASVSEDFSLRIFDIVL